MKDFFVSYNKADRAWAEWTAWQLEEAGQTTTLQAWDFRPSSNFILDMQQSTSEAERTIAILSPDYLGALYTQPEWAAAFAQDPTGKKGTLLLVRVRECELKGMLSQIVYIDLLGKDEGAAREALLEGIHRGRAKPSVAPIFPGAQPRSVPVKPRFPGALPPIWNVPHLRNPNFTGREEVLADLRKALTSGRVAALTQAISGLGGVGKTQLVVEYAYRHAMEYSVAWWVRSEGTATLASDYGGLATKLSLREQGDADQRVVIEAVKTWLRGNTGWLLIFDNAEEPGEVRSYIPQGTTGHVLVTSRYPKWGGTAQPLPVKPLPRDEAVEFLLKRTGQTDKNAASQLAEALGNLPLALEQASAYIEETAKSLPEYLELFESRQRELLRLGKISTDYPSTVATTWEISLQEAKKRCPSSAELMNLCSFLAPDDIPLEVFREGTEFLPKGMAEMVADPLKFDEALAALRRYSLLERSGDALSVHRLVQAVTRDQLSEEDTNTYAEAAVSVVNRAFPFDSNDVRTWAVCSRLVPHALATTEHAEQLKFPLEAVGRLLNHVGNYLSGRAQFSQARGVLDRALASVETAHGPNHPNVASSLNNLGGVLKALGDLPGARKNFERALAIDEAAYGANHPEVGTDVNNLGSVLHALGDFPAARKHIERSLAITETAYGPNHPKVGIRLNNLGSVLQDLGDLPGARKNFERALAIDEAAYGPNHPDVAIRVNNLGSVLKALGDLPGARKNFERALAIDEAAYGANHPEVGTDVNNLGSVLQALGDLAGAKAHYERAVRILRDSLGENHPSTIRSRNNLMSLKS